VTTQALVLLGFILFCLGIFGVMARRNYIVVLLSIELIFAGAGINFITFSNAWHNITGQVFTIFLIAVAAGEAAVGLGFLVAIYRLKHTANVDEARELRG